MVWKALPQDSIQQLGMWPPSWPWPDMRKPLPSAQMTLPNMSRWTGGAATASADCRTSTSAATKAASLAMPFLLLPLNMWLN